MPVTALVILVLAIAIGAQAADGPETIRTGLRRETRLRTGADLVLINASAYDRDGRLVTNIRPDDVRLFDEGVERQVAAFAMEDVPVSLAIVLDASRSMKSALPQVRSSLSHLSAAAKPEDEFLLITVRDEPVEAVPFSRDVAAIEQAIGGEQAVGNTAVIDALMLAFHRLKDGRNARRAILLFSDGLDTNSRYGWTELERAAREATAPVYAFVMPGMGEEELGEAFRLRRIAEETGGRCVLVGRSRDFPEKVRELDIHKQYIVGFAPAAANESPKYRRVSLKLTSGRNDVRLFWRRGYYR